MFLTLGNRFAVAFRAHGDILSGLPPPAQPGAALLRPALKREVDHGIMWTVVFQSDGHKSTATHCRGGQALGT